VATEAEIAWAAGFFEGEGYITYSRHALKGGERRYPSLGLNNTDREALDRFHRIVGVGSIADRYSAGYPKAAAHHKDAWIWRTTTRADAERVYRLLEPWLSSRRHEQAAAAFDELGDLRARPKEACPYGHAYTPENTYQWGKHRWCRTCMGKPARKKVTAGG
jgi:hypothetical protein